MNANSHRRVLWMRFIRAALLAVAALALAPAAPAADRGRPIDVTAVPIGRPVWQPVDFHVFSAPIGTAATGYAEFADTMARLLPPPDHVLHPTLGIAPGAPHAAPYGSELGESVTRLHLRERFLYAPADFTYGMGVWVVWMNVPAPGEAGASPDAAHGRVIPNRLFPIHVVGTDYHNGRKFSLLADFEVPPLDASLDARFAGMDGHSHFPIFIADNADFGPSGAPLAGIYRYVITMLDTTGQGWLVHASFAIVP